MSDDNSKKMFNKDKFMKVLGFDDIAFMNILFYYLLYSQSLGYINLVYLFTG